MIYAVRDDGTRKILTPGDNVSGERFRNIEIWHAINMQDPRVLEWFTTSLMTKLPPTPKELPNA